MTVAVAADYPSDEERLAREFFNQIVALTEEEIRLAEQEILTNSSEQEKPQMSLRVQAILRAVDKKHKKPEH